MRVAYATLLCCGLILTGCQSSSTLTKVVDTYQVLQHPKQENPVYISCAASLTCHFARVNDVVIIDEQTRRPSKAALEKGLLRLEGSVFALQNQYALSLWKGQHEIEVKFYPVSLERMESFHIIHNFQAGSQYKLVMYRQRSTGNGSLLQMAAPGSLCVDLLQNDSLQRRFCRTFDAMTGLGEFVEKKI